MSELNYSSSTPKDLWPKIRVNYSVLVPRRKHKVHKNGVASIETINYSGAI